MNPNKKAVVLSSGGLDSTTVLAMARSQGYALYSLSFFYGQRHDFELQAARRVANSHGRETAPGHPGGPQTDWRFGADRRHRRAQGTAVKPIWPIRSPVTYVPARNTIFLSYALAWAEVLGAWDIFIGVNAVDYSGYPDCRPEYIQAFETMANLATKTAVEGKGRFKIHTPADRSDQGPDYPGRNGPGRGLRHDPQLLRPVPGGSGLRQLRFLYPAQKRVCCGRGSRPDTLQ